MVAGYNNVNMIVSGVSDMIILDQFGDLRPGE